MASTGRSTPRRGQPSATPIPQKLVISVEDWEAKAPLEDIEIRSVAAVKEASEHVPLLLKLTVDDSGSSRPATPIPRKLLTGPSSASASGSRPSTPGSSRQTHALHPKEPVQTPQQFYDWYALIDRSVAHAQEAHFRADAETVSEHLENCQLIVQKIDEIESELDKMMGEWTSVEESGRTLKEACERLLEERDQLIEMTEEISERLEYFQELEHATRMLNHPGESLIFQADFLYMVEKVDICIEFLKQHRHYREADLYLLRFQQCMTRAMTLIKMNFVGSLRALTADISRRLSEKDLSEHIQTHLLYPRFASVATRIRPLLAELERRGKAYPNELGALLGECHAAYFYARRQLVIPRVGEEIRGLDWVGGLVELTRAGCSYLKQLCTDEFHLYREFFSSGEEPLYQYLETLCDLLYDDLRPRILHEPKLTALCEVCTVLQALMVLDTSTSTFTATTASSTEAISLYDEGLLEEENGIGKLHTARLLQMVLQDAQTRLFFKAQAVIQSDIKYYIPKDEDLDWPKTLIGYGQVFRFLPSKDKQETWYPTIRKMVWVLGQLRDFVKPAIFEDIAQEASHLLALLIAAADKIKMKSALDAQLFWMYLLPDIGENDFGRRWESNAGSQSSGGVTDTLALMIGKTTSYLPEGLFAGLGMRLEDSVNGVGRSIDHDLRHACEEVISLCSAPICTPLISWVERVRLVTKAPGSSSLPSQDWAAQSVASSLLDSFRTAVSRDLHGYAIRIRLYLEDERTVKILLDHVQDRIVDAYEEFRKIAGEMYAGALRAEMKSSDSVSSEIKEVLMEGKGTDSVVREKEELRDSS
ncbi:Sec34-domain-containing protein [Cyathus striatus]|nr:Sec34-domain-containing protein [Cyathus striatus]